MLNTYLRSLTDSQITELKKLSFMRLVAFLKQEIKNIQTRKENIVKKNIQEGVTDGFAEQFLVLDELMVHLGKKINKFVEDWDFKELQINEETGEFNDKKEEKEFLMNLEEYKIKNKDAYDRLIKAFDEVNIQEKLRNEYRLKRLGSEDIQAKMSDKAKAEFNALVVEYYEVAKKLDIDVSFFGLQDIYQKAKAYLVERYITTDPYQKLSYNINSAPAVNTYFSNNTTTELVPENRKDKTYYTQLLRWYPALDTVHEGKKLSEYLPYFNEDMTIKSEVPEQQKKIMIALLPQLKAQGKPYEKKLLGMTNSLTQTVAVEQCITTLQSYMDVNISEKENVMQQLTIAENRDAVSENLVVKINGTLKGKKIALSYNLLTGSVSYQSFMTKQTDTEQSPITIGANSEESVPLITLPKFGDFVDASKTIDYKNAIDSCSTQEAYTKKITETLQASAQSHQDMDNEKDMLKKYILKDMITQNIFSLTGRTTE